MTDPDTTATPAFGIPRIEVEPEDTPPFGIPAVSVPVHLTRDADDETSVIQDTPLTDDDPVVEAIALPHEPELARPARAARFVASAFILLTAAVGALSAWQAWRSYWLVRDFYSAIPTVTNEQLQTATDRSTWLSYGWMAGVALSGVAFIVWLWRARINAARVCDAPHRLRIRWSVLSWFIPIGNLWLPQMVLGDVWRASRPDTPARGGNLRKVRAGKLIGVWWALFLLTHAVDLAAVNLIKDDSSVQTFERVFFANAASGGLAVLSALAILVVMRRVDRWQADRELIR
ncbi:DUF4328 domain-containing protein [Actinokineospora auranticolor]|uniref:Uncharacterized protein DUF4328 n=1 Tax=Actinokineospora auranticolor TaxID=155976 RepID=A0A2S6GW85_9PSEU|nr:DUF4328 domain-containing protein [Actinokineospora auranticolor]PPK69456.1 uncharacterized protein DUF4328 [Actinokineospora auranticolor]